ncbi:thiamine phosphate synthase [Algoriphagus halophilus]|uniref:Thiamine-phosphate pyrophosphorylase n=1 Tax=Algoriphagus halophilus TaxID=226505 RepID=A0A1N6DH84_9BACT|nr:thiamine phosphate synthase [Algoriphagus halophilus]SIN70086.1 thiamine-phosphate pyrophosphorylase [Algoriphagus halophilus]
MKKLEGIYLVLDPNQPWLELLEKTQQALKGGVQLLQIWNHWPEQVTEQDKIKFCQDIKKIAQTYQVPVLINEDWKLAEKCNLDGVHLDKVPEEFELIRESLKSKIIGLTVGNQEELILWAEENQLSYISFCSVFPSSSVDTCELVHPESIQQARKLTSLPIFLSGGINPENLEKLSHFSFEGIAVISGILNSTDPEMAVQTYLQQLK